MKDKSMLQHKSTPSLQLFNLSSDPHGIIEKGHFRPPSDPNPKTRQPKKKQERKCPKTKRRHESEEQPKFLQVRHLLTRRLKHDRNGQSRHTAVILRLIPKSNSGSGDDIQLVESGDDNIGGSDAEVRIWFVDCRRVIAEWFEEQWTWKLAPADYWWRCRHQERHGTGHVSHLQWQSFGKVHRRGKSKDLNRAVVWHLQVSKQCIIKTEEMLLTEFSYQKWWQVHQEKWQSKGVFHWQQLILPLSYTTTLWFV